MNAIDKIGIPDSILLKSSDLNPAERAGMNIHVQKGIDMLERMICEFGLDALPDI